MFGFGYGSRNPRLRAVRIAAIVLVVLAGIVFHGRGRAYEGIRILYYVAIVGLVFSRYSKRGQGAGGPGRFPGSMAGRFGGRGGFPSQGDAPRGPGGGRWGPPGAAPPPAPGRPDVPGPPPVVRQAAGWYGEPGETAVQRYWDGAAWGARRRWNGTSWVGDG